MTSDGRPLRKNAQRNRDALVAAAREVLGRRGLQAPLDEIAQTAGVGNATLYRHFPTREDLLHAVFVDQLDRWTAIMDAALAMDDPWAALRTYLTEVYQLQAGNRAVAEMVAAADFGRQDWETFEDQLTRLLTRARRSGRLRPDVTITDIVIMLAANAGVVSQFGEQAAAASARLAALLIDGLQEHAATYAPPAPDFAALAAAKAHEQAGTISLPPKPLHKGQTT
jgi:AcrR family transcriptional regulator